MLSTWTIVAIAVMGVAISVLIGILIKKSIDKKQFDEEFGEKAPKDDEEHIVEYHHRFQSNLFRGAVTMGVIAAIAAIALVIFFASGIAFASQSEDSEEPDAQQEQTETAAEEEETQQQESMDALITEIDQTTRSMDDEASDPYLKKWGNEVDRQSTNYQLSSGQMNDQARMEAVGWAWAPTYGLKADTPEAKFEEWKRWLWANPIYGDGFARFLEAHGFTSGDRNPWITEMIVLARDQGYQNLDNPEGGFWYYDAGTWRTTKKYQHYAACLEAVADQFVVVGMTDEYIVEHWPMDTGSNNQRHMYLSTENPQVQHGLKLGFPDKFGPEGKGSISSAFLVDDADGRLEVPGDQPIVITSTAEYSPGCGGGGGGTPPHGGGDSDEPEGPPTGKQNMKDEKQSSLYTSPDARKNEGGTELTDGGPATATGANPNAGNDDGTSDSSNGVQDSSANQDGSTAPEIPSNGISEGATSAHNDSGTDVDSVTNSGEVDPD